MNSETTSLPASPRSAPIRRARTGGLVLALAWALLVAAASAWAQGGARPDYVVGARDLLVVQVFGEPGISGNYRVETDGTFTFPLIGRVMASGRTLRQAEDEIRKRLADGYFKDPQVSITVQEYGSQKIFVVGEVRNPGSYPLTGDTPLLAAIALAGSTLPSAGDSVIVTRPKGDAVTGPSLPNQDDTDELVRVSLRELQTGLAGDQNIRLQNGDTVFVPKAETIFVTGQVRNAGMYSYQSGLTVLQAIALAGGVTDRGSTSRVRITRKVNGAETQIKAKPTDLVQPGDTILVQERFF